MSTLILIEKKNEYVRVENEQFRKTFSERSPPHSSFTSQNKCHLNVWHLIHTPTTAAHNLLHHYQIYASFYTTIFLSIYLVADANL